MCATASPMVKTAVCMCGHMTCTGRHVLYLSTVSTGIAGEVRPALATSYINKNIRAVYWDPITCTCTISIQLCVHVPGSLFVLVLVTVSRP